MDEKKDIPPGEKAQSAQEIFPELKKMREACGLSMRAIFETTRVGLVNLTAVENGDYHRLPPPVYARDFIRKYARAIGTDEKPILDRYEKYLESLKPAQEGAEVQKPWPEAGRRYRFLFMSLAAVIVAGILVSALFLYDRGRKPPSPAPAVESPSAEVTPAPAQTAAVPDAPAQRTASGSAPVQAPAQAKKTILPPVAAGKIYHLIVEARELTWIRITEDRNTPYQVLLKPGDRIERMASDFFQLDIGNAGGINLTFQGKPLGSLGKQGQIIHMRLPEGGSERSLP